MNSLFTIKAHIWLLDYISCDYRDYVCLIAEVNNVMFVSIYNCKLNQSDNFEPDLDLLLYKLNVAID